MEEKLLTKKDLAKRWQVTTTTIDRWVADKVITPVKGLPSIRFSMQHILELEGVKIDKFSPLERRRLEKQIKELETKADDFEKANTELRDYVRSIIGNGIRFVDVGQIAK